jgi:hypothetical protein
MIARIADTPPLMLLRFRRAAAARGRVLGGGSRHALHRERAPDGVDLETRRLVGRGDDVGRWRCGFDPTGADVRGTPVLWFCNVLRKSYVVRVRELGDEQNPWKFGAREYLPGGNSWSTVLESLVRQTGCQTGCGIESYSDVP